MVIGVFLTPFYLSYSAYIRAGSQDFSNVNFIHGLRGVATTFEMQNLIDLLNEGALKLEYGLQYLYNLIIFIPRFLWQDKPLVSFSYRISEEIYGEMGENAWVHTYTPWGEGYMQFGFIGTVINTLIILTIIHYLKKYISRHPQYMLFVMAHMFFHFPIFIRGDLSSIIAVTYKLIFVILFVKLIHLIIKIIPKKMKHETFNS